MEDFFDNELVKKFEEMIENNEEYYFSSDELEDIIIHYLELGDIPYAELAVSFGLKLHPNSVEIKTKKLEILIELEQYIQVKELIKELKPVAMDTTDFLVCCAKYYSNLGNPRKAIEYCEKALELGDEENFLHNFIADEYVNIEEPFKALKHYRLALSYDPNDGYALGNIVQCYKQLNRDNEGIEYLKEYLNDYPYSEEGWLEYAQYYYSKGNYEEAIVGYDYMLAINSNSEGIYHAKADCYETMKQWSKAIEVYEELLQIEYTKAFTYYKIGLCYKKLKNWISALNSFQLSLREDPQFYMSMMEQSDIYYEMGKLQEALYFAKEAVSLNEGSLDYQKKLAFLYIDSAKFEESIECLSRIVEVEPDRFYNWYAYSEVLMLIGEYRDAIEVLNKAVKIFQRAELFYQMSNCYFHLQEEQKAKYYLEIALDLDPSLLRDMQQKYPHIKDKMKEKSSKKEEL